MELQEYRQKVTAGIAVKSAQLEKQELPKLKEEFRSFHTAISSLYSAFVKKGLITEDPYKGDERVSELKVPDNGSMPEQSRREQMGIRLANLDNQLDFFVNFYPFTIASLGQNTIKTVLALVNYIDWQHLSPDAKTPMTAAVASIISELRRGAHDPVTSAVLNDSLVILTNTAKKIYAGLKLLNDFNREIYKNQVREAVVNSMSEADAAGPAAAATIKKRLNTALPGTPFFSELVEEIIREDFKNDEALRTQVLKSLAGEEEKKTKKPASCKPVLIEGVNAVGGSGASFQEILEKINANHELVQAVKKGLWQKIRQILAQMVNAEPEPVIYEIQCMDTEKGVPVKEKLNYTAFAADLEKKIRVLNNISARGGALNKVQAMSEEQLVELLQGKIRDVQAMHKTLNGLDDFFKNETGAADRSRIRGIKPELGAVKNAFTAANQKLHDYHSFKEEEALFKKMGVNNERE